MTFKVCKPIPEQPRNIGPSRYESLYTSQYTKPKPEDYFEPKTGGGWFRHPAKAKRNYTPYKTNITHYNVEFSRVEVPEGVRKEAMPMDRNDPYIKYRDGFEARVPYQTTYNDMPFLLNKVPPGGFNHQEEVKAAQEYAQRKEREAEEKQKKDEQEKTGFEEEFRWLLKPRGSCGHPQHNRPTSEKENPIKYPFSMFDPQNVAYDRPLTPPPKEVCMKPKRVTEDDMRNEIRYGPRGTKSFYEGGKDGLTSFVGEAAADTYYRDIRPMEGTLIAMNAARSINSKFMS